MSPQNHFAWFCVERDRAPLSAVLRRLRAAELCGALLPLICDCKPAPGSVSDRERCFFIPGALCFAAKCCILKYYTR